MTTDSPASSTVHARDALHALLCSLFPGDGRDLRHFANGDPALASVVDSVPWMDGLNSIVHEFIERCAARGLVDEALFRRLLRVRPYRHPEIAAVARLWGYELPVTRITGPVPKRRSAILIVGSIALVGLTVLAMVMLQVWPQPAAPELPAAVRAEELPAAPEMKAIPTAPAPPKPDEPLGFPAPPVPSVKSPPSPRCQPPSKQALLDRLRKAGREGGPLRRCWLDFWAQATIRSENCSVQLHGDSLRESTLTFTNQMQRVDATACLSTAASGILATLNECPGAVDHTFILAEIEPPGPGGGAR